MFSSEARGGCRGRAPRGKDLKLYSDAKLLEIDVKLEPDGPHFSRENPLIYREIGVDLAVSARATQEREWAYRGALINSLQYQ